MKWKTGSITAVIVILVAGLAGAVGVSAAPPGNEHFQRIWAHTDKPVADGAVDRTWMWGPEANTEVMTEPYAEAPGGERQVQYFDKARMEITRPDADPGSLWYVTNGLLVVELMTGQMQVGHAEFEERQPARINIAGDPGDPDTPTYATYGSLTGAAPFADGETITSVVDREGNVSTDDSLAEHGVTAGPLVPETNHRVASVFWEFMTSSGVIYQNGEMTTGRLFPNPYYATGFPVTEAYWAQVNVGGEATWVLTQAFERRVMTYTPGNPDGFKVEAGNVGQHYYTWRYEQESEPAAYEQSMWWPYLSAHINDEDPEDVLGGPVTVNVTQEDGAANWVFPGPRQLDPTVFGTPENPRGTNVPALITGVPEQLRETLPDGTQQTSRPTPFSNNFATTQGASIDMTAVDETATDGATTKDQIDFEAVFNAPMEQGQYRIEVNQAAPHGWFIPTAGGVITNFIQHGVTGWGTRLMPTEYVDVAFWGMGSVYKNGELMAENRLVHVMLTELVRGENYELAHDSEVNPDGRHLHVIVPPFTPKGEHSAVPTGFTLPNGQQQPFFHVMFPNIEMSADMPEFTGELPESFSEPAPEMPAMTPPEQEVYKQSLWWPYLSAHVNDEEPEDVLGGPIVSQVTQQDGAANWVLPGPRKLDPTVFGTPEDPKGTNLPAIISGVPGELRETLPDGTQQTNVPTPFSDNFATTQNASVSMTTLDATATDAATTKDRIAFEATFEAPMEQGEYRVTVDKAASHGWFSPTAGGVMTNFIQHGVTGGWGTRLMPTEYDDVAFWGMGNIYKDGELVAENRLVHAMVTELVRGENYELAFDSEVNPDGRHLHLIVPPFTPFGKQSPVPTGFTLPNGQQQPFLHVMFPNIAMEGGRLPQ